MRALRKNRGPPGPKVKGGLPLKNIKLKGTGVKPRAVKSKTPLPRAAMRRLWLQSKSKTVRALQETPFHQEEQNAPGTQAASQMVDATVKAPAQAVYQAGKKLAQDTAHKLKDAASSGTACWRKKHPLETTLPQQEILHQLLRKRPPPAPTEVFGNGSLSMLSLLHRWRTSRRGKPLPVPPPTQGLRPPGKGLPLPPKSQETPGWERQDSVFPGSPRFPSGRESPPPQGQNRPASWANQ